MAPWLTVLVTHDEHTSSGLETMGSISLDCDMGWVVTTGRGLQGITGGT